MVVIWQAIIAGVVAIILGYLTYRTQIVMREIAILAANRVENVRVVLVKSVEATDNKLTTLTKVAEATHVLVNSAMQAQLDLNAIMARRLATITKDPGDIEAANAAEKLSSERLEKQALAEKKERQ